ncbi:MAG: asparaginase [Bacillaceae bacterium]|nr:asparaginase [Bacillaceae bacterium]
MTQVAVINTGGTIAMGMDAESDSVKPTDEHAMERLIPLLEKYANVKMDHYLNIPSPHMTPEIMYQLAQRVHHYLEDKSIAGVVVTHGTDTLEETAYFLDLVESSEKPVIVTGAMRSSNELGADGPVNLVHSVRTAVDPSSSNRGTIVVFNDEIHAARFVTKTHTSNVATFQSPQYGTIGQITHKQIKYYLPPLPREHYTVDKADASVPLIKATAGMSPEWLKFLLEPGIDGVVIEALGQGNLPPSIMPVIRELSSRKIPVVMVSRCFNGFVQDTYGYEGGGKQLKELGVIFSNGLNGQKARIKLIVALETSRDIERLKEYFSF